MGIVAAVALVIAGGVGLLAAFGGGSDNVTTADDLANGAAVEDPGNSTGGEAEEDSQSVIEDAAEGSDLEMAAPVGAEELARSVVQIQLLLDGQPTCTGSGTIVDPDGTVVTNFHVVEQSPFCPHDQIGVAMASSSQMTPVLSYEADLLAFDIELDLAVIKIARTLSGEAISEPFESIAVGDSNAVGLGDQIQVIGFPGIGGDTVTFTTGSVSGFTDTPAGDERRWMKTDATITGGNSGGLAADLDGNFIGVPSRVGTGDGQIVDCRVIADSNGDGALDDNDSCVPIGGFINGIRPVALALPLIEASLTASPIDQGPPDRAQPMARDLPEAFDPLWSSGVSDDGVAIDEIVTGTAGQNQVCITWDYANVPIGALNDAVWVVDGEAIDEVSVFDSVNDETSGTYFHCISSDGGLAAGVYEMVWLVEDEVVFAEAILVGSGATATIEIENVHSEPICVVQFNPTGTSTYGLNELADEIQPGDTMIFDVAVGPLDARIIDCDGSIRIEDPSGFEVLGDLIVTVD